MARTSAAANLIGRWVPESELSLWDANPRDNDASVPKVAESIKRYGFVAPLVVWTSKGQLVAGHTRLKAFRSLLLANPAFSVPDAPAPGMVPVRFHEFASEQEASAYAIADNRLVYEADWDYEKLVPLLESIGAVDPSLLAVTGFREDELNALMRSVFSTDHIAPLPSDAVGSAPETDDTPPAHVPTPGMKHLELSVRSWDLLTATIKARTGIEVDAPEEVAEALVVMLKGLAK